MVARKARLVGICSAAIAAFALTAASLDWPDLLDEQWRTRGQLAWYLEAGKGFLPFLAGGLVAAVIARLTRQPRKA